MADEPENHFASSDSVGVLPMKRRHSIVGRLSAFTGMVEIPAASKVRAVASVVVKQWDCCGELVPWLNQVFAGKCNDRRRRYHGNALGTWSRAAQARFTALAPVDFPVLK